jgi:hypothetical protein
LPIRCRSKVTRHGKCIAPIPHPLRSDTCLARSAALSLSSR